MIELLVVVGIIMLLIAMLVPVIHMIENSSRTSSSMNQVQQVLLAMRTYADEDARHFYPTPETPGSASQLSYDPANTASTLVLLERCGYSVKHEDIDPDSGSASYRGLMDGWQRPLRYVLDGPYLNGGALDGHLMNGTADRPAASSEWNPAGEEPCPYVWSIGRPTRNGDAADALPANVAKWLFPKGKS